MKIKKERYDRKCIIKKEIVQILSQISTLTKYVYLSNERIKTNSDRYHNFNKNGFKCVFCGLEASYGAIEKDKTQSVYHINIYGVNDKGLEVMLTKDHIYPKARGGKNCLENYQVLCEHCNENKKDNIIVKDLTNSQKYDIIVL